MRVLLIDPSGFTLPYDHALAGGLAARNEVVFRTRPARPGERPLPESVRRESRYFLFTEGPLGRELPERVRVAIKGGEYLVDALRLLAETRARRPDVIHLQWMPVPAVDGPLVRRLREIAPVVATVHDTAPFRNSPSSPLQALGWAGSLRAPDRLIVHTEYSRRQLLSARVPAERIEVVPHGVLEFPGSRAGGAPRRQGAGTEEEPLRVLLFGAVKRYKGADLAVRALAALPPADRARVRLRVVGKPRMDVGLLRELAATLGVSDRVSWDLRFVPDAEVAALLSDADVLLFPYREVDASGAILAALPAGRAMVATAVGGIPELVDSECALLVPPRDPDAIAAALQRLLDEPSLRESLGAAAARRADTVPSWDEIARRTEEVYARAGARPLSR